LDPLDESELLVVSVLSSGITSGKTFKSGFFSLTSSVVEGVLGVSATLFCTGLTWTMYSSVFKGADGITSSFLGFSSVFFSSTVFLSSTFFSVFSGLISLSSSTGCVGCT